MTLPTFTPGIDISATGGSHATGTGAATNGRQPYTIRHNPNLDPADPAKRPFDEFGFPGVMSFGGYIQQASQRELYWPGVYPIYNRLRRSDPEVSVVRQVFSAVSGDLKIEVKGPEEGATGDDQRAVDFAYEVLDDLEDGIDKWRDTLVSHVPFMGWGWWEAVPGLRRKDWVPPDKEGEPDPWRSQYDDGLIGFRRLAFRDHSSFLSWDISDATGRLRGMRQMALPHQLQTLPLDRSVHITFGDTANPEGLTPSEGLWRLERIKYGLEIVQGIGYEHAAGYLDVSKVSGGELTATDKSNVRDAARAILSAQEGNYALWPTGFAGKVVDVNFGAGAHIMEAIRYYGLLKLALFNMQWVGMSSITDRGSYSALHDASSTWMVFFNAMMAGFVKQLDEQLCKRLFDMNKAAFPKMTKRPHFTITPVEKFIELDKLGQFLIAAFQLGMPLGDDDWLAIRRKSGFLPEVLPEPVAEPEPETPDDSGNVDEAEAIAADEIDNPDVTGFAEVTALPSVRLLQQGQTPTGVMVALFPQPDVAKALAVEGGEAADSLHLTLAYLGKADQLDADQRKRLREIVRSFAALHAPLAGRITGTGSFEGDGESAPCVALVDIPALPDWRQRLIDTLKRNGFQPAEQHGFIPHITLKYTTGEEQVAAKPQDIKFDMLSAAIGGRRSEFPLKATNTHQLTMVDLLAGYTATLSAYQRTVYDQVLGYLVQDSARSTSFRSTMGRAVVESFNDVFYSAYQAGGGEDLDADDDGWLTARENAELANVGSLFIHLKAVKDEKLPPGELVAEAQARSDGYAGALREVYSQGLLRGQKNKMLTMVGVDGKDSCAWCQQHKGQRYSARKWLRIGIPGVPGNGTDCDGWRCRHGLQDDMGVMWTLPA